MTGVYRVFGVEMSPFSLEVRSYFRMLRPHQEDPPESWATLQTILQAVGCPAGLRP